MDAHYIAVDWSGAADPSGQRRHIVAAESYQGRVRLTSGRTREETIAWLIELAGKTPHLIVGLDFAFSYPAWFLKQQGAKSIEDFWTMVANRGESWLAACHPPFWGRPGKQCPADHRHPEWQGYRHADRLVAGGRQPSSPFQIGGAGAVGTGSLRGIPLLLSLRQAGFCIWPFHAVRFPLAMEIYPRLFTGQVNKSSLKAREEYLHQHLQMENLDAPARHMAIASEDAFDALCSVIGMERQAAHCAALKRTTDGVTLLEGAIFPGKSIAIPVPLT